VKSSRALLILALFLISTSRAVPALLNNAVFSTDSWPLIRLTERLIENPEIRVFSLRDHHVKWPLAVITSLVFTEIVSVDVEFFYAYLGAPVLVLVLAVLLYVFLSKLTESALRVLGLLALLIYPPFVVFTSAYLKEVYAYPLALLVLVLTLTCTGKSRWIAVLVGSIALVLSHPLTALVTLVFTATLVFVELVDRIKYSGVFTVNCKSALLLVLVLGVLYLVHAVFIGVYYVFNLLDIVVLGAYSVVLYGVYSALYINKRSSTTLSVLIIVVLSVIYALLTEGVEIHHNITLYGLPLVLLSVSLSDLGSRESRLSASFLLPVLVGVFYTLTYAKWLVTITHRFLNYMVFPVALNTIILSRTRPRVAGLVVLVFTVTSCVVLYTVSTGRDPFTFYWRYTVADTVLGDFIREHSTRSLTASVKYQYLLGSDVVNVNLNVLSALRTCSLGENTVLIINSEEFVYGVPVTPLHYIKPTTSILQCSSVVYSSLVNYVVAWT